jgi:hypothetical protein
MGCCCVGRRRSLADVHGVDHGHGVVPDHERGHEHGVDHAHVHV